MRHSTVLLALLCLALPAIATFASTATGTKVYLPLVACPGCLAPTATGGPAPDVDAYEAEAIRLVNEARAAVGCPAAVPHSTLMTATGDWSEYMDRTGDYRHSSPGFYEEAPYFYNAGTIVENISGASPPRDAVDSWLQSPRHKANIETCIKPGDASYDPDRVYNIGIGYVDSYWTLAIGFR